MTIRRLVRITALLASIQMAVSCGRVQSAGNNEPVTVRVSSGSPTGNFRPFSEALAKGYAKSMPDLRIQSIETPGSVHNIEALQDGVVDIGVAQASIAYMAYNGQLP